MSGYVNLNEEISSRSSINSRFSFSRMRTLCPLSIPAGIVTLIFFLLDVYPVPAHFGHFSFTILPEPPQFGHVCTFCTVPKRTGMYIRPDLYHRTLDMSPVMFQALHLCRDSLRKGSFSTRSSSFSHPKTASSNVMRILFLILALS